MGLTVDSDRLPVISAIAAQLHKSQPDDTHYLAGFWSGNFFEQSLLWMALELPPECPGRPNSLPPPTWSWASVKVPIQIPWPYEYTPLFEVLSASCEYVDPNNPFGAVVRGRLVIRGRLLTARFGYSTGGLLQGPATIERAWHGEKFLSLREDVDLGPRRDESDPLPFEPRRPVD
ncbi:hypothetical protein B0H63DRAFT_253142 [Podospora didyma]|uniref:Uncharacterized protein n=1 Tax=Podospora didyma TaxID=330526 RepID=A0AAE0KD85_9PEZI|nr:hypothetical protein B0H63DRAFT_253142 [Podospora didyma]